MSPNKKAASFIVAAALLTTTLDRAQSSPAPQPTEDSGPVLSHVQANGIRMRVATQGEGPLVLLLHGFPESWYSWRHQLRALADAGYRAVAPDMRGYGGTDAPAGVEAYDVLDLCADVSGLMDALGEDEAVLIGHDWGAVVAWACVTLEPQRFTALVAMSVPRGPRTDRPPLELMREGYGENFYYMLYFQEPGVAEAELDADPRGLLKRFLASPGTPREPAAITDPRASAGGLMGRIGMPRELPAWLAQEDLDYFVAELERSGFRGGLNYYRNIDRSWELTAQHTGSRVEVPVLFIAGDKDIVVAGRDRATLEGTMRQVTTDLRGVHLLPGAGHWIQQERPAQVNELVIDFLSSLGEGPGGAEAVRVRAAGAPDGGFGRLNREAPPETAQFSFLIGEWDCKTKFMSRDGSTYNEGRARWTGYFILDGWAIQDHWIGYGPDGQESHGTNVRSFNPRTKKWDNRWLSAGALQWQYFEAEQQGDTMVMTGGEGRDPRGEFIDRNTFYDMTSDHWRWRKDRSYDGGKTWIEGVGFIEATRSADSP